MAGLGIGELIIILAIILLLFGGKKLPELSRSLGNAIKELRRGFNDSPGPSDPKSERKQPDKKE